MQSRGSPPPPHLPRKQKGLGKLVGVEFKLFKNLSETMMGEIGPYWGSLTLRQDALDFEELGGVLEGQHNLFRV